MLRGEKLFFGLITFMAIALTASFIVPTRPHYNMGDCKYMMATDHQNDAAWVMGNDPEITIMKPVEDNKYWCLK